MHYPRGATPGKRFRAAAAAAGATDRGVVHNSRHPDQAKQGNREVRREQAHNYRGTSTTMVGLLAQVEEFTVKPQFHTAGNTMKLQIDCRNAQLLDATNGYVYVVSTDGTTLIFRNEAAKQLRQKYSEQSSAETWDLHIKLDIQIVKPVVHPTLRGRKDRFLLRCSNIVRRQ